LGGDIPFVFRRTTAGTYGRLMLAGFSVFASVVPSLVWGQRTSGIPRRLHHLFFVLWTDLRAVKHNQLNGSDATLLMPDRPTM